VTVQGLVEDASAAADELRECVEEAIEDLSLNDRRDDEALREAVRSAIRRILKAWHGKRPVTEVHVVRI